jgi:EpsI family protein
MIGRRDLLIGGASVAGSAAAYLLTPRRHVSLMPAANLSVVAPAAFGGWVSRDVTDLVAPKIDGSLASRLYNTTLERIYSDGASGAAVMVLLAYGDTQSNELQLHRPEVCYPAFGFDITANRQLMIALGANAALPARNLVAEAGGRHENIVYWTRLGEYLPTTENEQRVDRVKTALHGVISDGILARFSLVSDDPAAASTMLGGFVVQFIRSIDPGHRAGFIGTRLASALAQVKS